MKKSYTQDLGLGVWAAAALGIIIIKTARHAPPGGDWMFNLGWAVGHLWGSFTHLFS